MGTIIEDYLGAAVGIHFPIPHEAPGSFGGAAASRVQMKKSCTKVKMKAPDIQSCSPKKAKTCFFFI